jgi:uncharacterized protein YndB with AHSA1/START domain
MATNISTIYIKSTVQRVWDVLTKPEFVKQWQYGSDLMTDWKTGSEIRFRTEWQGKTFEQWGRILEIRPGELIRYSLFAPRPGLEEKPENFFVMNYLLIMENNQVKLDIIQEDNRPGAVQEKPQGEENPVLQALKNLAESFS